MSRHLTPRFWFYIVIAAAMLFAALVSQSINSPSWFIAASPPIALVAASIASGWWPAVGIERVRLSGLRVIEGDEVTLTIDVRAPRPVPYVDIELQLPASLEPLDPPRLVVPIQLDTELRFRLRAAHWGVVGPEFLNVVTRDRFGLTETIQQFPLANRLHVHPTTESLRALLPAPLPRTTIGDHRSRARGPGVELAEVREYRANDPVRLIHPRLSQRRGRPMVAERHTDRSTDVILFVDAVQNVGTELDSTLRTTVAAAAGLLERHGRSMDRVGILDRSTGVRWLPPDLGRRAGHILVDALLATRVMEDSQGETPGLPLDSIDRRAMIIAISPLLSEVFLSDLARFGRRQHPLTVIAVDRPPTAGIDPLAFRVARIERQLNIERLRELGVQVLPWSSGTHLDTVLARALTSPIRSRQRALQPSGT